MELSQTNRNTGMNERIIIIEDDQGVRFFLEEALKGEGYKVSSFESYEDAIKSINNGTGLVIMAFRLPRRSRTVMTYRS